VAHGDTAELALARRVAAGGQVGPLRLVRRLHPALARDPLLVRHFLAEAAAAARLVHPGVVQVLEVAGAEEPLPWAALERVQGVPLAQVLERATAARRPLPVGPLLRALAGACRGLAALQAEAEAAGHPASALPRALTPHALLVTRRGEVRLLELGTCRPASALRGGEARAFAAPEVLQARGGALDRRADVFSLGAVARAALLAGRARDGMSAEALLPPAVGRLLAAALAASPAERPPDAEALGAAMELAARAVDGGGAPGEHAWAEASCGFGAGTAGDPAADPAAGPAGGPAGGRGAGAGRGEAEGDGAGRGLVALGRPGGARAGWRQRWWAGAYGVSAAVVALHVAVAAWTLWPDRSPADRLSAAARTADRAARERELLPLAADADASPEDLRAAARLLLEVDGFTALQSVAEALEARSPADAEGPLLQARASAALRMDRVAEQALARASQRAPGDVRPAVALADLRESRGDGAAALAALAQAHARAPGSPGLAARYGALLAAEGRLEEAAGVLAAAAPGDGRAAAELGLVRYRQGRLEEARAGLVAAARAHPREALVHYYLGVTLYRMREPAGAEQAWREADRLQPADVRALAALCELVGAQPGRTDAAHLLAQELRRRFPAQAEALHPACLSK
jgi:Flp pilus assembly protein TadD